MWQYNNPPRTGGPGWQQMKQHNNIQRELYVQAWELERTLNLNYPSPVSREDRQWAAQRSLFEALRTRRMIGKEQRRQSLQRSERVQGWIRTVPHEAHVLKEKIIRVCQDRACDEYYNTNCIIIWAKHIPKIGSSKYIKLAKKLMAKLGKSLCNSDEITHEDIGSLLVTDFFFAVGEAVRHLCLPEIHKRTVDHIKQELEANGTLDRIRMNMDFTMMSSIEDIRVYMTDQLPLLRQIVRNMVDSPDPLEKVELLCAAIKLMDQKKELLEGNQAKVSDMIFLILILISNFDVENIVVEAQYIRLITKGKFFEEGMRFPYYCLQLAVSLLKTQEMGMEIAKIQWTEVNCSSDIEKLLKDMKLTATRKVKERKSKIICRSRFATSRPYSTKKIAYPFTRARAKFGNNRRLLEDDNFGDLFIFTYKQKVECSQGIWDRPDLDERGASLLLRVAGNTGNFIFCTTRAYGFSLVVLYGRHLLAYPVRRTYTGELYILENCCFPSLAAMVDHYSSAVFGWELMAPLKLHDTVANCEMPEKIALMENRVEDAWGFFKHHVGRTDLEEYSDLHFDVTKHGDSGVPEWHCSPIPCDEITWSPRIPRFEPNLAMEKLILCIRDHLKENMSFELAVHRFLPRMIGCGTPYAMLLWKRKFLYAVKQDFLRNKEEFLDELKKAHRVNDVQIDFAVDLALRSRIVPELFPFLALKFMSLQDWHGEYLFLIYFDDEVDLQDEKFSEDLQLSGCYGIRNKGHWNLR